MAMSSVYFIDTNIFIRYLNQDDLEKYQACLKLFRAAEAGTQLLVTSPEVIAEVVHVLHRRGKSVSRSRIRVSLSRLIVTLNIKPAEKNVYLRALALFERENIDFEDCVSVARMADEGITQMYSYDRDFDRFEHIVRLEPEGSEEST